MRKEKGGREREEIKIKKERNKRERKRKRDGKESGERGKVFDVGEFVFKRSAVNISAGIF
ncbi:MAG: hypothetical protein QXV17_11645 [Candidatus Micrarchaeaceae archaeon]